jgi:hypothetical protein
MERIWRADRVCLPGISKISTDVEKSTLLLCLVEEALIAGMVDFLVFGFSIFYYCLLLFCETNKVRFYTICVRS